MKKTLFFTAMLLCTVYIAFGQWTYTNLSEPKYRQGVATLGTKAYFAGGANESELLSEVEIYDVAMQDWDTIIHLSVARSHPVCVSGGGKIFIAGGIDFETMTFYDEVDIWDTETEEWSIENLLFPRFSVGAVSYGTKVMFAGGANLVSGNVFDLVEIYDMENGTWSYCSLSMARCAFASAIVGDEAIFAGGYDLGTVTDRVDIYNFTTNTWTTTSLSEPRGFLAATTAGNKALIAGGVRADNTVSDRVDIYDATTKTWDTTSLSEARAMFQEDASSVGNKAYFVGGGGFNLITNSWTSASDVIDIYDASDGTWDTDNLSEGIFMHTTAGVGNNLIVAGGVLETLTLTSLVEILYVPYVPHVIHVPADYSTIQEGINAASNGDTVLVADSTYYENINFIGKHILVTSEFILDGDTNHISNTIINGSQPVNPDIGSVVTFESGFESGEDTTSVLCGFTITGGSGTLIPGFARMGGGVLITSAGCKLQNNYIEYNEMTSDLYTLGGGICAGGPADTLPWVVLRNNRIIYNKAISLNDQGSGGGMEIYYPLIMVDNQISYNEAKGINFAVGGGARLLTNWGPIELNVKNNRITHNKAEATTLNTIEVISGGVTINGGISGNFSNNFISNNENVTAEGKWSYGPGLLIDFVNTGDLLVENNIITNNSFTGGYCVGGGLSIYNSKGTFQNNVIMGNLGTHGGGIGIQNNPTSIAVLLNNTVAENDATIGSGMWASSANAVVVNSIIYGNTPPGGSAIFAEASTLEVRYSNVQGDEAWPGEGNVNCNPMFLADGYHLDPGCQLVNSGIDAIEINGTWYECPPYDIDGDVRPYASTQPEIGVDEVDFAISIQTILAENRPLKLYPNPAKDKITISSSAKAGNAHLSIFNISGEKVIERQLIDNETQIDISTLPRGVYFVRLQNEKMVEVGKMVKE